MAAALVGGLWGVAGSAAFAAEVFQLADVHGFYDSNVTNAGDSSDIRIDRVLDVSGALGTLLDADRLGILTLTGILDGSFLARYSGVDAITIGSSAVLTKKIGLGAYVPYLQLRNELSHSSYNANLRDGWFERASAGIGQRFQNGWVAEFRIGLERRTQDHVGSPIDGNSGDVFQQSNRFQEFVFEVPLSNRFTIHSLLGHRSGDANLTVQGKGDEDEASAIALDPAFGPNAYAEKVLASSILLGLDLRYAIDHKSTLGLGILYQVTVEDSGDRYRRTQVGISYSYSD